MNKVKVTVIFVGLLIAALSFFGMLKVLAWVVYMDILTVQGIIPHAIPSSYYPIVLYFPFAIGLLILAIGLSMSYIKQPGKEVEE